MKLLKRAKITTIITSILYIALGVVWIASPAAAVDTVCTLFGILIIISGVAGIFDYFAYGYEPFGFVNGIVNILFGILVVTFAPVVLNSAFFPIMIGLVFTVKSVFAIQDSLDYRRAGIGVWWIHFLFALALLCLGVILLIDPFDTNVLSVFIGVSLITDGLMALVTTLFVSSKAKKARKTFKEAFAPVTYEIKDADEEEKHGDK